MSKIYHLNKSRNGWKNKAQGRRKELNYHKRENKRLKKQCNKHKQKVKKLEKQLSEERSKNKDCIHSKEELVYLTINLFIVARIGFRAIERVLTVIGDYLGIKRIPSTQTVINWVIRLSISRIKYAGEINNQTVKNNPFSNGYIYIIDTSIGFGRCKILPVLGINCNHYALNERAPNLNDIHCVSVSVSTSWTGEMVADLLQKIMAASGRPVAFLKDGGTEFTKAFNILEDRKIPCVCIDDISHTFANILKRKYQNHPLFDCFISICGKVSKNFKQTILACLAPPKVSTKARFMNIHRLIKWADQLLNHSKKGRAAKGSLLEKLRSGFDQLPKCKGFIKEFLNDASVLLKCQKVLKNKGMSYDSFDVCQKEIEQIPLNSSVRNDFLDWANRQLIISEVLGLAEIGMPITTDPIESAFGVGKNHGASIIKDANRIGLFLPALCGNFERHEVQRILKITVQEQREFTGKLPSLIRQRRKVLPNPGSLNKILEDEDNPNLSLIPGVKNVSKNVINLLNSNDYKIIKAPKRLTGNLIS